MKVEDVFAQLNSLLGKEVIVEGFLVEKAPEYRLYPVPDDESRDDVSNSVRVDLSELREQFQRRIPS